MPGMVWSAGEDNEHRAQREWMESTTNARVPFTAPGGHALLSLTRVKLAVRPASALRQQVKEWRRTETQQMGSYQVYLVIAGLKMGINLSRREIRVAQPLTDLIQTDTRTGCLRRASPAAYTRPTFPYAAPRPRASGSLPPPLPTKVRQST